MRTRPAISLTVVAALAVGAAGWAPPANRAHAVYEVEGSEGTLYGWAVSELSDVDGDGATDWSTGAILDGGSLHGSIELRSGATGTLLHRRTGEAWSLLGYAVADAGDVDGDGVHDVAAGAPGADIVGVPQGLTGYVELVSGATGELLQRIDSVEDGDHLGAAVGDAGDLDGDGAADVLVGAPGSTGGGSVHVVSGDTGDILRTYDSPEAGARFGSAVDAAGDLDGDGFQEHLIGAMDAGPEDRGAAYVYDGASGERLLTFTAAPGGDEFGRFFVAGVGDVDGDGVPDLYVGDYADDTDGPNAGSASVFSGADGALIHRFVGEPGSGMGPGRAAGDLDRDGHTDLVVGSFDDSTGAPSAGAVTVFAGRTGQQLLHITSDIEGEQLGYDAVGLGDTTGDGKPELLVSAASGDRIYLYRGTGVRRAPR